VRRVFFTCAVVLALIEMLYLSVAGHLLRAGQRPHSNRHSA
jgi:hypothetical protein